MTVSERIRRGLIKPGSIYARFGELTPFQSPIDEQRSQWQARAGRAGRGGAGRGSGALPLLLLLPPACAAERLRRWPPAGRRSPGRRRPGALDSTASQDCGMTEAAAHKARQAWPPYQAIHGTVLLDGQQQQQAGPALPGQQLLALGAQPLGETLALVAQLAAAAAAGAGAALYCSRRAKGLEGVLPRQSYHARSP